MEKYLSAGMSFFVVYKFYEFFQLGNTVDDLCQISCQKARYDVEGWN